MDAKEALALAHSYAIIVRQDYPNADIYLFGSRAAGTNNAESDIDIAVVVEKIEGDWLENSSRLWRLRQNISSYIEPILLNANHDASGFVQHIRKTGKKL